MGFRKSGFARVAFRRAGTSNVTSVTSAAPGLVASPTTGAVVLAGSGNLPSDAPNWAARTGWFVDPQNSSGNASDTNNTGADSGHPLATVTELFNRIGTSNGQSIAVTLMSSMNSSDHPVSRYVPAAGSFNQLTITGTPTVVYTSTFTAGTANASATPTTTENQAIDAAVPGGTWTAAGALTAGRAIHRTSGTACYMYPLKDEGANTLRVSFPYDSVGQTFPTIASGDTYNLESFPIIRDIQVLGSQQTSLGFPALKVVTCDIRTVLPAARMDYSNCTYSSGSLSVGQTFENVGFNTAIVFEFNSTMTLQFIGGAFRGTGARVYTVTGPGLNISFTGPCTFQGAKLAIAGGVFGLVNFSSDNKAGIYIYDCTASACLTVFYWSNLLFFQGVTGGVGNTGLIMAVNWESQIAYTAGTNPYVDGQTSSVNKFSVGATAHVTADLPVAATAEWNGVFSTQ